MVNKIIPIRQRIHPKTRIFTLNVKNSVTQKIIELKKTLITEAMDRSRNKEKEIKVKY